MTRLQQPVAHRHDAVDVHVHILRGERGGGGGQETVEGVDRESRLIAGHWVRGATKGASKSSAGGKKGGADTGDEGH